ncbi:MAG: TonB-dependent receptor [Novosphingobium sp.]|nr:TonB-dependent receptor [Novosphingobium sp.]
MTSTLLLAASAAALPAGSGTAERPEIVVTGERISRGKHETASSVAVYDGSAIDKQAAPDRIEQLLQMVPNVQLGSGGEGPVIRGQDTTGAVRDLSAFLSGNRPRTTITVDGRPASYYELAFGMTSLWDVERVEVFRSPQTTTQGRNSIAGAIFVETAGPSFDWEGRVRGIAGDAATRQVSAAVSGPLATDQVAFRASGDLRRSDTSSVISIPGLGIDPNRDETESVRLKLLARPDAVPDASLSLIYAHVHSQMPQVEGVEIPYEARRNPNGGYGLFAISVNSLTGRLSYQPTGRFEAQTTVSYGHASIRRHAPAGFGEADITSRDFSVEPLITWRPQTQMRITGGVNFTRIRLRQTIDLSQFPFVLGSGTFADRQTSLGVFGEASLGLGSGLTVNLGLRYQRDRQIRRGALAGEVIDLPLDYDRSSSEWLPKAELAWDPTPELRIGALVQRASNSGGVNLNFNRPRVEIFDREYLWDFELYARARLADGRIEISANAFRYEMFDAQRSQLVAVTLPGGQIDMSAFIANAPRAWTMGFEAQASWRPSRAIELSASVGLLDTRITETISPSDGMRGKQFQRSPHFSGSASVDWRATQALTVSAQLRHNSSYFSDDLESIDRRIGGSTTVDAKVSWARGSFTVFGYARNLFDGFHLTYLFGPPSFLGTAADPRELGLGVEARF